MKSPRKSALSVNVHIKLENLLSSEFRSLKTTKYLPKPKILMHFHIIVRFFIPVSLADVKAKNSSEGPNWGAQSILLHECSVCLKVGRLFFWNIPRALPWQRIYSPSPHTMGPEISKLFL